MHDNIDEMGGCFNVILWGVALVLIIALAGYLVLQAAGGLMEAKANAATAESSRIVSLAHLEEVRNSNFQENLMLFTVILKDFENDGTLLFTSIGSVALLALGVGFAFGSRYRNQ